jgi:hypothetical protein
MPWPRSRTAYASRRSRQGLNLKEQAGSNPCGGPPDSKDSSVQRMLENNPFEIAPRFYVGRDPSVTQTEIAKKA